MFGRSTLGRALGLSRSLCSEALPPSCKRAIKGIQLRVAPRPMMAHDEIGIVRGIIRAAVVERVVEFGSGGSTLFFPRFLPANGRWTSFEFDERWFAMLRNREVPKSRIVFVRDAATIWQEYAEEIATADLVIIDGGPDRSELIRGVHRLNRDGITMLHDSWRLEYSGATQLFEVRLNLTPPYGVGAGGCERAGGLMLLYRARSNGVS